MADQTLEEIPDKVKSINDEVLPEDGNFKSAYYFFVLLVVTIPGAAARNAISDIKEAE